MARITIQKYIEPFVCGQQPPYNQDLQIVYAFLRGYAILISETK